MNTSQKTALKLDEKIKTFKFKKLTLFGVFQPSFSRKPQKIEEIGRYTTESSQLNPFNKKYIKLDEK